MKKKLKKVLVVDDDPIAIRLLERWLRGDGKDVIAALSGHNGVKRAKEEQPDCIILDLMIPDINGVDVARQLEDDDLTRDIPIIFMTMCLGVENDKGDENIDIDGRFYRTFAKPLHKQKLLSVVRKSINKRIYGSPI